MVSKDSCSARALQVWAALVIFHLSLIQGTLGAVHIVYGKDTEINVKFDAGDGNRYVVGVVGPGADSLEIPPGRPMEVVGPNGTRYTCYLPGRERVGAVDQPLHDATTPVTTDSSGSLPPAKTPEELLDGMGEWCAYRVEEWWTYEVCYKKSVRQYHADASGQVVTDQYLLGNYSAAETMAAEMEIDSGAPGGPIKFARHFYTGGDRCEVDDGNHIGEEGMRERFAEVRYTCGPGKQSVLIEVREPKSCSYVITVATPRLCKHHAFAAVPSTVVHIPCHVVQDTNS